MKSEIDISPSPGVVGVVQQSPYDASKRIIESTFHQFNHPDNQVEDVIKVKLFYSYSPDDGIYLEQLKDHLALIKKNRNIQTLDTMYIPSGENWKKEIHRKLNDADIVLLLVSASYISSEYRLYEASKAIELNKKGRIKVIPIYLRYCHFEGIELENFSWLPSHEYPIISRQWENKDQAFKIVVEKLDKVIEEVKIEKNLITESKKIKKKSTLKSKKAKESVKKILLLASNPKTTPQLRLDEEIREIDEGLRRSKYRERFEFHSRLAVRLRDLRRALLDVEPHIVHFTGYGQEDGLMVEDELGMAVRISAKALAGLFSLCSDQVECVILGACYSAPQATAISKHINYVIGMKKEIKDKAALEFAVGFYDALGAGKPVEQAFKFGCNAILQVYPDLPEHLIPTLKKRKGVSGS